MRPGAVNRNERDKCDYKYWHITGSSILQGNPTQRLIKPNYRQANSNVFTSSPSLFFFQTHITCRDQCRLVGRTLLFKI